MGQLDYIGLLDYCPNAIQGTDAGTCEREWRMTGGMEESPDVVVCCALRVIARTRGGQTEEQDSDRLKTISFCVASAILANRSFLRLEPRLSD